MMHGSLPPAPPKRAWSPPRLVRHESLTVLTQTFLGAQLGVQFNLLQVPCSVDQNQPSCFPIDP